VDVASLLFGHSKALYSTWIFYKPDHLLIDCGEGAATNLGNGGYAIEKVLLTHGHIDHISGLPSLLWSRAAGMGDNEKPIEIYHPRDDLFLADMQQYLERTSARLPFDLKWIPLEAGDSFAVGTTSENQSRHARQVQTFATQHIRERLTLGYKIVETRRRLKAEFTSLSQAEIRARVQSGGPDASNSLMEDYQAPIVAWSGDTLPLNPAVVRGCELLFHEATIVEAAERKHQWHSTLDEAVRVAAEAQVKNLVLYHISGRYNHSDIRAAVAKSATWHAAQFPIWCLFRDRLSQAWPEQATSKSQTDRRHRRPTPNRAANAQASNAKSSQPVFGGQT
jgi:ribonuclease Z